MILRIIERSRVAKAGVDAINIPDGPRASESAILTALMIEEKAGIETPALHLSCRNPWGCSLIFFMPRLWVFVICCL